MRFSRVINWSIVLCLIAGWARAGSDPGTYHGNKNRDGLYTVPGLTAANVGQTREDTAFYGPVDGNVYPQPLYYLPPGAAHGRIVVATSSNYVYALNSRTGSVIWSISLGPPVPKSALQCGDIDPVGILGTPAIRDETGIVYLDAMVMRPNGPRHLIYALSMADGSFQPGYPINVKRALAARGIAFDPTVENQRSAVIVVDGKLYVPYGGFAGDCGAYHGWVVGVDLTSNQIFGGWSTRAPLGGIWAQSGIAYDGKSMFVATGNTRHTSVWGDGEAVIRLPADLSHSSNPMDYFTPQEWMTLDKDDFDLGSTGPVPLDVPTAAGTQELVLAMGKDDNAYLLDRNNLGGIGQALVTTKVSFGSIITAPAIYPVGDSLYAAFHATWSNGGGVSAIKITAGSPPGLETAWQANVDGLGSPIVTTSDGSSDPIVWAVGGGKGDEKLHAFSGTTGGALYSSAPLAKMHPFQTILAAEQRLYIATDNRIYAFSLP